MRYAPLVALLLFACSDAAPPPYGFALAPEQRWRLELDESFDVAGTAAKCVRSADLLLRAKVEPNGATELELYLDRYYTRVEGTPNGPSELSISEKGVRVQTAAGGVQGFGPNDRTLGGDTPLEMRARPMASVELDANGMARDTPWSSPHPLLMDLALLDWLLLGLPTLGPAQAGAWNATRTLPQTGRFNLGLELPLRWQLRPDAGPLALRASGTAARANLEVAPGLEGELAIEVLGETDLLADGRVRETRFELRLSLVAKDGSHVASRHLLRARCTSCDAAVNPSGAPTDSAGSREGTAQQGHLDDLPDHGGVR